MFRYTSTELLTIRYDRCPAPCVVDILAELNIIYTRGTPRPVRRRGKRAGRRRARPILTPAGNGAFVFTEFSNRRHSPCVARHPPNTLPVRTLRHTEAKGGEVIFGLLNIRSINNKLHDLLEVCREHSLNVIGLCETWHDETSAWIGQLLNDGYQVVERARPRLQDEAGHLSTNHGGVAICAAPGIRLSKFQLIQQFQSLELVIARVTSVESCILAVVYRPGSAKTSQLFFSEMSELLGELASHNGPVYVVGDLNVRLDRDEDAACCQLRELFSSYNFTFQPTNATHVGGGMLDVVAFNCGTVSPQTRVIDVGLSDHHLVSWSVPLTRPRPVYTSTTRRAWHKIDTIAFLNELSTSKLCQPTLWPLMDVDEMARLYDQVITDIAERLVPVTTATCRRRPSDPWFDDECRAAKRKLRFAERKARSTHAVPDDAATLDSHWKELRRAYRLLLRQKREAFWNYKVDSERVDPRRLWQSLNTLLGRGRTRAPETPSADAFAEYLHKKDATAHASVAEHDSPTFSALLTQGSLSSFQSLSPDDVAAEIRALPDKQCASDPMPTALLKESSTILAPFLSELFNRSMSSGSVPEIFKSAYITPRLKKPNLDTADVKSFRPISNLSVLSKLLERLVSRQFTRYLTTFNLLPDLQSAYRVNHSTETAVLKVSLDILRALDAGDVAVLVLLDLTAAFDTVDHGTLLKKLEVSYGLSGRVLQWFSSYLTNRVQYVRCAGSSTPPTRVVRGVPQGSVLGPILFALYVADLISIVQRFGLQAHLYADDTQVYGSSPPAAVHLLQQRVTRCLVEVTRWLKSHQLQLNAAKTEVLWITSERQKHLKPTSCISIDGLEVQPVSSVRNLGIHIDSTLSMRTHVSKTIASCFNALRLIRSVRRSVSVTALKSLVSSLVMTKLDYGNATLAGSPQHLLDRLQVVLNAAARLIFQVPSREHVTPLLRDLHWLSMPERIQFKLATLAYRCLNGIGPTYLATELARVADQAGRRHLRSARTASLVVPSMRLRTVGDRAFPVTAARAWNCLPSSIQLSLTPDTFKKRLKTWLFRSSYCNV